MVPSFRIIEASGHVDAVGGDDEMSVIQVVLIWRVDMDHRAGLLSRIRLRRLLREHAGGTTD
jgi:hypothetical protein